MCPWYVFLFGLCDSAVQSTSVVYHFPVLFSTTGNGAIQWKSYGDRPRGRFALDAMFQFYTDPCIPLIA